MREALSGVVEYGWPDATLTLANDYPGAWAAAETQPDLCISDLVMPGAVPLEGIARLRRIAPEMPILVVTGNEEDAVLLGLYQLGIAGFVPKTSRSAVIEAAIRVVLAGEHYMPARVLQLAIAAGAGNVGRADPAIGTAAKDPVRLSPRQHDVLALVATGQSTKEIARNLNLSPSTVKAHTAAAIAVLGAANRAEAVAKALRLGMIFG